jgi:hypothetical protein
MRLVLIALLICSCKPSATNQSKNNALQKLVDREVSGKAIITKNKPNTFALATLNQDGSVDYVIVRLSDNKVVVKNKIRGSIEWSGDMQISETQTPGMIKKDSKPSDFMKVIDLNQFVLHPD